MWSVRVGSASLILGVLLAFASSSAADQAASPCAAPSTAWRRTVHAGPTSLEQVLKDTRPGDSILLDSGDYGDVRLAGENAAFVSVGAAPGQSPRLATLEVRGRRWVIRDLVIDGSAAAPGRSPPLGPGQWPAHPPLVRIFDGDNITLWGNTVTSLQGDYPWTAEAPGVDLPKTLFDGIRADNTACLTVAQNHVFNVFNAMQLGGDQSGLRGRFYRIENNRIDNFAGDGIDHSIGDSTIYANRITDSHDICEQKCIHTDGIQGWNYASRPGIINRNMVIDSNVIIQRTRPILAMDNTSLQGITIFDGFWANVRVTNNVVVTNVWHGVTMSGVDGLLIANNTVVSVNERRIWIRAGDTTHQGGRGRNVIVRNNIVTSIVRPAGAESYRSDHNLEGPDPASLFVKFDVANGQYDLRPRRNSAATGRGSPEGAPAADITGASRATRVDIGAYQSVP